jgi:16S rRNA (cytosine967-C5)-methyltransferase
VVHSQQPWVARLWFEQLGPPEARALMAALNEPGERALRVNTLLADPATVAAALPVPARTDPLLPEALVLEQPMDLHASPLWAQGAVHAQSRASMLVAHALDPQPGERVLDLCAAPGAKSTHIAALMGGSGEVVAVERDPRRARILQANAERLRAGNIRLQVRDAAAPVDGAAGELYDRVLVDPPCTGLGTLQAHPDLRWRVRQSDPERLAELQRAILDAGAAALRPGGVLVYSTCTVSATENERLIADFLASHPGLSAEPAPGRLRALSVPGGGAPESTWVTTLPHRDGTAGFFIARMRRD